MVLGYELFVPLYILYIWNYFEASDLLYRQNQVKVPNFATCFILVGVSDKNKIDLTNTSVVVFFFFIEALNEIIFSRCSSVFIKKNFCNKFHRVFLFHILLNFEQAVVTRNCAC